MSKKNRTVALAYLRTSSTTNVGADKDSDKRQRLRSLAGRVGTPRPPSGPKCLLVRGKTEIVGQLRIIYTARQNHSADT